MEAAVATMEDWEGMAMDTDSVEWSRVKARLLQSVTDAYWFYMQYDYKLVLTPP